MSSTSSSSASTKRPTLRGLLERVSDAIRGGDTLALQQRVRRGPDEMRQVASAPALPTLHKDLKILNTERAEWDAAIWFDAKRKEIDLSPALGADMIHEVRGRDGTEQWYATREIGPSANGKDRVLVMRCLNTGIQEPFTIPVGAKIRPGGALVIGATAQGQFNRALASIQERVQEHEVAAQLARMRSRSGEPPAPALKGPSMG